jgi:succinylarginine dihydrolase
LGFKGDAAEILSNAVKQPELLANYCSASAMWAANAGTVSPSADTADGRLHITPANLVSNLHRSLEPSTTTRIFRTLFADESLFAIHDPLPATPLFSDEGAANHGRLCPSHEEPGIELFTYGADPLQRDFSGPKQFPARQTLEASQAVARRHGLSPSRTLFVQRNPAAIDAGCFHNDVISVANETVFLYHEEAFLDPRSILEHVPVPVMVRKSDLSLEEAVSSYLFNSQLISKDDGSMLLVAPQECQEQERAREVIAKILDDPNNPIDELLTQDLRQSMRNGGGPACLRLRIVLTPKQKEAVQGRIFLDNALYDDLTAWVSRHYRDKLLPEDLTDPLLVEESYTALDQLCQIMELGSIYPFQQENDPYAIGR